MNLHTAEFQGGAIRGQLAAEVPNTALPVTDRSLAALGAVLLGLGALLAIRMVRPVAVRD